MHYIWAQITYGNKTSSFNELLEKGNSASIHHKNLQSLAMEILKISNDISFTILKDIFAPSLPRITCIT